MDIFCSYVQVFVIKYLFIVAHKPIGSPPQGFKPRPLKHFKGDNYRPPSRDWRLYLTSPPSKVDDVGLSMTVKLGVGWLWFLMVMGSSIKALQKRELEGKEISPSMSSRPFLNPLTILRLKLFRFQNPGSKPLEREMSMCRGSKESSNLHK